MVPLCIKTMSRLSQCAHDFDLSKQKAHEERATEGKGQGRRPTGPSSYNSAKKSKSSFNQKPSSAPQSQKSWSGFRPQQSVSSSMASTGDSARPKGLSYCNHCRKNHEGECWWKQGACLRCGSLEHFVRDCPKSTRNAPASTQRSATA